MPRSSSSSSTSLPIPYEQEQELVRPLVVRVVSAEIRNDLVNNEYTAYIVRIVQPSTSTSINIERRYSDFYKLHNELKLYTRPVVATKTHNNNTNNNNTNNTNNAVPSAPFPSKHWAGRIGNWTPSKIWTPERYAELINTRTIQLDHWIVQLVSDYNNHSICNDARILVYSFLLGQHQAPWKVSPEEYYVSLQRSITSTTTRCRGSITSSGSSSRTNWNNPFSFTLSSAIRQATRTVKYMTIQDNKLSKSDKSIPLDLLQSAKGLVFLTVLKAGLVVSGRVGTGLIIAKLGTDNSNKYILKPKSNWSCPCAIGTVGMGWGAQMGADVTHYLIVLTTDKAVQDFCSCSNSTVQLGAEVSVAVGPVGRGALGTLASGDWTVHPAYAYAHSQGLFVGISLEGSVLAIRHDVNSLFYEEKFDQSTPSAKLLQRPGCPGCKPLYDALDEALAVDIPEHGFRPSLLFSNSADSGPSR